MSHGADTSSAAILRLVGSAATGARYAIHVPASWNRRLVLYAHGYTPPSAPLELPNPRELTGLLAMGYAVAYSSYSETGYAVKDGAQRTHELRGLVAQRFGAPQRTYLIGHSLGGIISLMLAEKHPEAYDGALLVSGVLGGTRAQLEYLSNVRVLFDCFFPDVLPGGLLSLPQSVDFKKEVAPAIAAAVQADIPALVALARVDQTPLPYADVPELVGSVTRAIGFQFTALDDLLRRTRGGSFFDNSATRYTGALSADTLARLDGCVARYRMAPAAAEFASRYYEPTGKLKIPVLTLHRPRDPEIPVFHEALYRERVARWAPDLLVQRIIPGYGHGDFTAPELVGAFTDLAAWVEKGVRPSR